MTSLEEFLVLPDTNGVIELIQKGVRTRLLDQLCDDNRLKIVDAVARELKQFASGDAAKWVARNPNAVFAPTQEALDEIARLSRQHGDLFTATGKAADPALVATGLFWQQRGRSPLVVTDDHGVQAVCFLERVEFVPSKAYRALLERT